MEATESFFEVGEKKLAGVKRGHELDSKKGEEVGGVLSSMRLVVDKEAFSIAISVEERWGSILQPAA
ncbi:hypothetical protein AMTR_s00014p00230270 [Amborella trichopoda]|uniref:Uncharacterized protein n=1 Tax=Amborella trichopoda TaxID=13333 RepID=W1PGR1_AMBTC|nr:hypothetical protein AMTR_s00014p00230270 [Amborella trichopoda]